MYKLIYAFIVILSMVITSTTALTIEVNTNLTLLAITFYLVLYNSFGIYLLIEIFEESIMRTQDKLGYCWVYDEKRNNWYDIRNETQRIEYFRDTIA